MTVIGIDEHRARARAAHPAGTGRVGAERVGLDELTSSSWRVVDRRSPAGDPFRILALIRSRGFLYEVMQFGRGFEWTLFATLEHAVAHVVVTAAELARVRGSAEDDWPPSEDDAGSPPPR